MFIVIYKFEVIPGLEMVFEKEWEELTRAFIDHANGLGSRLHNNDKGTYIAYAQWPDETSWSKAGTALPEMTQKLSNQMRSRCSKFEVLYTLDEIKNLLQVKPI